MENVKVVLYWLSSVLILLSIIFNVYLSGIVYIDRIMISEQAKYIQYRDSIQLIILDKLIAKPYATQKTSP
jgi:hypothetical protein